MAVIPRHPWTLPIQHLGWGLCLFASLGGPASGLKGAPPETPLLDGLLKAEPFSLGAADLLKAARSIPVDKRQGVQILLEDDQFRYDSAGRQSATFHFIYRVDQESAVNGWGYVLADWQPWLEERPVIRARVITPDGEACPLDTATLGEFAAHQQDPELLQDGRVLKGPLPKLRVGALVEVEIQTREHRPLSTVGFRKNYRLAWSVPVGRARTTVQVPAASPLKWRVFGLPSNAVIKETLGDQVCLRIDQSSVEALKPREPFQAWDQEHAASMLITTAPSWAKVAGEYLKILEPRLREAHLKAWALAAIGEAREPRHKIDRLLAALHRKVRYVGLEFGEGAIVPRTPDETLERGYGDCKDQATLLVALLREVGLEAHPVLLRAGDRQDFLGDFPGLAAFNHVIVKVEGAAPLWIDPSVAQAPAGQLPLQDCGRNALVIAEGTRDLVRTPEPLPEENCTLERREVFLAEEGAGSVVEYTTGRGVAEILLRGNYAGAEMPRLRERLKRYVHDVYKSEELGVVTLTDTGDFTQPFRLGIEARKVGVANTTRATAKVEMNPWALLKPLNDYLDPGASEADGEGSDKTAGRRTDLQIPHAWSGEMDWLIHPPAGYRAESLPPARNLALGPAVLTLDWKVLNNGAVRATFRLTCAQRRWSPAEVERGRAAVKAFGDEPTPVLVFQQVGEGYLQAGRLREALDEFRAEVAAAPQATAPLLRLARAQFQAGLGEPARETLRRALVLDPDSEDAHRQLGWVLQHDLIGRRFCPGWDRAGAIAELRKAMALAPGLRQARMDLAILLGHDERGTWHASRDLEEVVKLCREQLALGADSRAQYLLTVSLVHLGRFKEARVSAGDMKPSDEASDTREAWVIATDACLHGPESAVQEARTAMPDPRVRCKAFREASDALMEVRRYREAGVMAAEAAACEPEDGTFSARAKLCAGLKRFETVKVDRKTPMGAVQAYIQALEGNPTRLEAFADLVSPAQWAAQRTPEDAKAFLVHPRLLVAPQSAMRLRSIDELFSTVGIGMEGSDQTGYRLKFDGSEHWPNPVFVNRHGGLFRIVAWGGQPDNFGREALWELERGNLEGARAWLDRATEFLRRQGPSDSPLQADPAGAFWVKGCQGNVAEARLAAALLVLGGWNDDEPSRGIVAEFMKGSLSAGQRGACLVGLWRSLRSSGDLAKQEAVVRELLALFPDDPGARMIDAAALEIRHHTGQALAVMSAVQAADRSGSDRGAVYAAMLFRAGRFAEGKAVLRGLIQSGRGDALVFNNLAWADCCTWTVTEETAHLVEQALAPRWIRSYAHTQACTLVELRRFRTGREVLLKTLRYDETPRPYDWYVFARAAELLGETATARSWYARAETENESAGLPDSWRVMARKRLEALEGKNAPGPSALR